MKKLSDSIAYANSSVQKAGDTMAGNLTMQGIISASTGSVFAPEYTFSGDLSTGMWRPAANTVAWSTAGVERMRCTSVGYFGIGTNAPVSLLSMEQSNSGGVIGSYIKNNGGISTGTLTRFAVGMTILESSALLIQFDNSTNESLILNRKATTGTLVLNTTGGSITISNPGNVGIGTTTQTSPLQVKSAGKCFYYYTKKCKWNRCCSCSRLCVDTRGF